VTTEPIITLQFFSERKMKGKILTLAISFFGLTMLYGQTTDNPENEASFGLGTFYTQVLSNDLYGFNFDFKYYPFNRIATGLNVSISKKEIGDSFSDSIQQPVIDYYELGWLNQYDFLRSDKMRMGFNISNGVVISRLGDKSIKESYWTEYGFRERSKEVATNYFYLLQPGLDISFRLFSKNGYPDLYLTTKAKYRFVFGENKYGQLNDFSNFYFQLGLSMLIFTGE
jgi:hypothetical protein